MNTNSSATRLKILQLSTLYSTSRPKNKKKFIKKKNHIQFAKTTYKFKNFALSPVNGLKESSNTNILSINPSYHTISNDFKSNKLEQIVNSKKKFINKNILTRNNNYNSNRDFYPTITKKYKSNHLYENLGFKTFNKEKYELNLEGYINYL